MNKFGIFLVLCFSFLLASCGLGFSTPALPSTVNIPSSTLTPFIPRATYTPMPTFTPTVTLTPTPLPHVYRGDLHMHTTCSDGHNTYDEMVQAAVNVGLDFIAVTDHAWCPDTYSRCIAETRIVCFGGKELSQNVHILAIGISGDVQKGPVENVVDAIHRQGGIAIAAHPWYEPAP